MTASFITYLPQCPVDNGCRLTRRMFADGSLSQKFSDGLLTRSLDGTDQQAIFAQVKHVQGTAARQSFPLAPFQRENRLPFAGQGHGHRLYHGNDLLPHKRHLSTVLTRFCRSDKPAGPGYCPSLVCAKAGSLSNLLRQAKGNVKYVFMRDQPFDRW
jgi:hypothetical protein